MCDRIPGCMCAENTVNVEVVSHKLYKSLSLSLFGARVCVRACVCAAFNSTGL